MFGLIPHKKLIVLNELEELFQNMKVKLIFTFILEGRSILLSNNNIKLVETHNSSKTLKICKRKKILERSI